MPGHLADITGIKARTCKLINHARAKPARDRVFHAKQVAYRKGGKNKFDIQIIAIALDKLRAAMPVMFCRFFFKF